MKTPAFILLSLALLCAARAEETYPELKVGNETLKDVRVIQASPADLLLGHEGGFKRIKLPDLPEPLKSKYPFDAKKAEEFEKQKAAEARARQAQTSGQIRAGLLQKEQQLRTKIDVSQKEMERLKTELKTYNANARGRNPRSKERKAADAMRQRIMATRDGIWALQDELDRTQKLRLKYE